MPLSPILAFDSTEMGFLTFDPTWFYQWPSFATLVVIYSALVCSGELSKEGPLIFSKRNTRTLPMIFQAHLAFLTILFVLWKFAFYLDPHLPDWMTSNIGRGSTAFNLLFFVAMIVMGFIERRWLYVESENEPS